MLNSVIHVIYLLTAAFSICVFLTGVNLKQNYISSLPVSINFPFFFMQYIVIPLASSEMLILRDLILNFWVYSLSFLNKTTSWKNVT